MTNGVSLLGLFAPSPGARDPKATEDNMLASFAGVLAGVTHANAKLVAPPPKGDGATNGDPLENADDASVTVDAKQADDSEDAARTATAPAVGATAVTAVASVHPSAINSSIGALNPALREKLARVTERMRQETGHDVQVTETYRSQSRQNALYAQGRETAGPVVTWTQHSKHTQGRAVDVTIDGGRASADGYAVLQRIANEEGLRTLGAKDPGHLELPSKGAATGQAEADVIPVPDEPADASGPGQVSVARLAEVASVARVAVVASVGTSSPVRGARMNAMKSNATVGDAKNAKHQVAATQSSDVVEISDFERLSDAVNASRFEDASQPQSRPTQSNGKAQQEASGSVQSSAPAIGRSANNSQGFSRDRRSGDRDSTAYSAIALRDETRPQFSRSDLSTAMPSTAPQRAERIMAAQDAPARPLSQIVMSVDAGNGTTDRIQVALRGSTVSATIDAADDHAASAMRAHGDELVRSLTRDGVDVDSVRVRTSANATAPAAVATVDASQKSSDASNNSRFNRDAQWDQQRSQQRSNNERRHHQRGQRGGKES